MTKTRRSLRAPALDAAQSVEPAVVSPSDRLRQGFPPGSGRTPWAVRPGSRWTCTTCGKQVQRHDLAIATVRWTPWGRRVLWQAAEWRHFVQAGIPGNGTITGVESALRVTLESGVTAVRWDAEAQTIKKARGRLLLRSTRR
jgi:hypothetical protein